MDPKGLIGHSIEGAQEDGWRGGREIGGSRREIGTVGGLSGRNGGLRAAGAAIRQLSRDQRLLTKVFAIGVLATLCAAFSDRLNLPCRGFPQRWKPTPIFLSGKPPAGCLMASVDAFGAFSRLGPPAS
jgi:hypothetical protein